ncbi:Acyl-CoA synthetase (AMP-forming)/AMP-acid ligase II [Yoonia tamlensis]|uniref:Acyl-CoA synthetase (AMP-forming)/AMP-acid ligase II n=1 Tax=Yoonia tamlensis TaxID=390270 RepID=A0A1I6GL28_9RHOB|nr:fatty acid--CoA ligase family protein [Yoonia tamlensis]SFR42851.1 Acyl-CoA synthetase (AMP-forming)/AMP-acid ligase II [Yoonia tamlensis]
MGNIGTALFKVAQAAPASDALVFEDLTVSYLDLVRIVATVRARLMARGITHQSFVVLDSADALVVIATAIATASLGAKFATSRKEVAMLKAYKPTHFFHTDEIVREDSGDSECIDQSWTVGNDGSVDIEPVAVAQIDADCPWLIVHTSGSTGLPKFIGLSQNCVRARSHAASDEFIAGQTRFVSLFGPTARPFLSRAFAALLNGATIVISKSPAFWLQSGVTFVMGSPIQVQARLKDVSLSQKIDLLHIGGAHTDDALITRLLQSFERVVDAYGASETNHSFNNIKQLDIVGNLVTTGQARDSQVEIVNSDGQKCKAFQSGFVRIKNPYLAEGYIDNPAATAQCFRDGWFYPGDLAHWGEDGQLVFEGRADHVINLGGVKVNALAVDHLMRQTAGISDAICFKNPKEGALNELLAFAVFDDSVTQMQSIASAKFAIEEKLGELTVPKHIRPINFVPRCPTGEPDRAKCAQMVLEAAARGKS